MQRARLNYFVDGVIALAFLGSALSGIVFLVPLEWSALTTGTTPTFLGLSFRVWNDLHIYSSLAMMSGVGLHLVLHWTWLLNMTRQIFSLPKKQRSVTTSGAQLGSAEAR